MATRRKSSHDHGPSEIWERPAVYRTIAQKQRSVGERLRALRHDRGLNLEEAAEEAGIHPVHLQRIETAGANATLATLTALALAYEVELSTLFGPSAARRKSPRKKKAVRYKGARKRATRKRPAKKAKKKKKKA